MDGDNRKAVMVTGGRGFLGRAVVELLRRSGERAISLDLSPVPGDAVPDQVVCDIADVSQLERVFGETEADGVIHLAVVLPTAAQRNPVRATNVNVIGSSNLLEMARRFSVRRFVFGSSLSVYGSWPPDQLVSEDSRTCPEDVYGAAKLYVEQIGNAYRNLYALEFVALRIGRVVGPGARSATSAWRSEIFELLNASQAVTISIPYVAEERVLLVHVNDVARMLVTLQRRPQVERSVYNAPCEAVVVGELKLAVEAINSKIDVRLGTEWAAGNPRLLDSNQFQVEFGFQGEPIFEQLRKSAEEHSPRTRP
jgi:nucleoside-diphosphate-sugar epimerase